MTFGHDEQAEVRRPASRVPDRSTFKLRRFDPVKEACGEYVIEEIVVVAHSISTEETSAISFVDYKVWNGQVIPYKHRVFNSFIDVEEVIVPKSSLLTQ